MTFQQLHPDFVKITGQKPSINLCLENTTYPFAHEAGVFLSSTNEIFITSNRIETSSGSQRIQISKVTILQDGSYSHEEINPDIPMANGGVKYKHGILFCSQGTQFQPSGIIFMEPEYPYRSHMIVDSFYGRQFNSPNDVVVHPDGSIWFTDPMYGYEQGFRPKPELPNQVYRYDPSQKSIRVVADGFGRPNGIAFSPDNTIVYITDTDCIHGNGNMDLCRPSTVYAFDISYYHKQPFLVNRRVFAMTEAGIPDGIKVDIYGNVYSGCGDGIHVWSPGGVLLGKVLIPGGVSNFCFGKMGEIFALNETRLWKVTFDNLPLTLPLAGTSQL